MPNPNPIRSYCPSGYSEYQLPQSLYGKKLYLSTGIKLNPAEDWRYSEMNEVTINGDPKYPTPTKLVTRFEAGRIGDLAGLPMSIRTRILLAYVNEKVAQDGLPETAYSLSFFADDDLIEIHQLKMTLDAPRFCSKIKISLQP